MQRRRRSCTPLGQVRWREWIKGESSDFECLARSGEPNAADLLVIALGREHEWAAHKYGTLPAAWALRCVQDTSVVEGLVQLLNSSHDRSFSREEVPIWVAAAGTLGHLRASGASDALVDVFRRGCCAEVRMSALDALVAMKDPRAVELAIERVPFTYGEIGVGESDCIVGALGELGDQRAVKRLVEALCRFTSRIGPMGAALVRLSAADALLDVLASRRRGPRPFSRDLGAHLTSAWVLGELKEPRAVEPLIHALAEPEHFDLREAAAEALGKLQDERAVAPLRRRIEDPTEYRQVRDAACSALQAICDKAKQKQHV
jgi:HEAT repeat protein